MIARAVRVDFAEVLSIAPLRSRLSRMRHFAVSGWPKPIEPRVTRLFSITAACRASRLESPLYAQTRSIFYSHRGAVRVGQSHRENHGANAYKEIIDIAGQIPPPN